MLLQADRTDSRRSLAGPIFAMAVFCFGATPATGSLGERDASSLSSGLPASYIGVVVCGDCRERKLLLNLRPDDVFHLRQERFFEATDTTRITDQIGVWELSEQGDTLLLHPTLGKTLRFVIRGDQVLSLVDAESNASGPDHDLGRMESFHPIEPRLFLRGKFSLRGPERVFRECVTGRRLIVEERGDYPRLELGYRKYRDDYGEDLLVSLQGRIIPAPGSSSEDQPERLVVERYGGIWPVEVCGRWSRLARLVDTFWYLMNLGGEDCLPPMTVPEPYLRLDGDTGRFEMIDGCGSLQGDYSRDGDKVHFALPAEETRDCVEAADLASACREILRATATWSIEGALLRLYDENGELLAWFEPRFKK